uniref:Rho-GAP domain-containing protein n=1 Tax=Lotharella globosa TaxID=91324 RepID=A0A7S3Y9H3_9EUKA
MSSTDTAMDAKGGLSSLYSSRNHSRTSSSVKKGGNSKDHNEMSSIFNQMGMSGNLSDVAEKLREEQSERTLSSLAALDEGALPAPPPAPALGGEDDDSAPPAPPGPSHPDDDSDAPPPPAEGAESKSALPPLPPPDVGGPAPPPAPTNIIMPIIRANPAMPKIYKCLANPGLGYRRSAKFDDKVEGEGLLQGEQIEGEEKTEGWIYVASKEMWLPLEHDGKALMQRNKDVSERRASLLKDIASGKGRSLVGARGKLLNEIRGGKSLKKTRVLKDEGVLHLKSHHMQEAIIQNLITYDQALTLWKFFAQHCKPGSLSESKLSASEKLDEVRKKFSPQKLGSIVRRMKSELKPATMTYVKKKYLNCCSGAEMICFLSDSKKVQGVEVDEVEAVSTLLLDYALIRNASNKKMNNAKGLPIRADQYYRYGDIVLHQGPLLRMHKKVFNNKSYKKRYYRLVESAIESRTKRQTYRFESYVKKSDKDPHSALDVTEAKIDPIPRLALEFVLKTSRVVRLKAADNKEKQEWIDHFKAILGANRMLEKPPPTFGAKLSVVAKSKQNPNVPVVVWECVEHIRQYGMKTEGVFRKPGLRDRIVALKDAFDAGISPKINGEADVHNAAGCLKLWLRELPEPLIPFQYYKPFLNASTVEEYRKLIQSIPTINQELLSYLCQFLEELSTYHEITRMHTKNIALVFAPNLLRSEVEDPMEAFQNSDKKIDTFSDVIKHVHPIFGVERQLKKEESKTSGTASQKIAFL